MVVQYRGEPRQEAAVVRILEWVDLHYLRLELVVAPAASMASSVVADLQAAAVGHQVVVATLGGLVLLYH